MNRTLSFSIVAATLLSSALAQDAPRPEATPRPPELGGAAREERPPLPPGEMRERPQRGPDQRGPEPRVPGGRDDGPRPPFPPPPGGERRPEGLPPREGERRMEGRRFDGERRMEQPGFPGGERNAQQRLKPTPYLGVITSAAPPALAAQLGLGEGFGLVVDEVLPESPAATAGVQRFDVLKQFNEQQLIDPAQLGTLVRGLGKDKEAALTVIRKGQEQKLTVKIGEKMLPERRAEEPRGSFGMPDLRRGSEMNRGFPDMSREVQERMQRFQERLRDYQREMSEWQEKLRQWQEKREGEIPKPPPAPMMDTPRQRPSGAVEPGQPASPTDMPRGAPRQPRAEWSEGSSRWDASRARMTMRDREGEVELGMKDGHRTLTARNPAGETTFTGPVDTPEQRNALPEPIREKLRVIESAPQPQPRAEGFHSGPEPQSPPRSREANVQ